MSILNFLYKNKIGRVFLRPLISKPVSDLCGKMLDSRISKVLIGPFAKKNAIRKSDYQMDDIHSFNDFFCRRIRDGLRPVSEEDSDLSAPCDGLLSGYEINEETLLSVKQCQYSIHRLLRDRKLASGFQGGYALVFRLCVNHLHRYMYFDSGWKYKDRIIDGVYHTVRPVALEEFPVYVENSRQYSVIDTDQFGRAVQMEVGAMLVGRIVNEHPSAGRVLRGEEKGHFEYGGSTVILLLSKDKAVLRQDILDHLNKNVEIPVMMGEVIGRQKNAD